MNATITIENLVTVTVDKINFKGERTLVVRSIRPVDGYYDRKTVFIKKNLIKYHEDGMHTCTDNMAIHDVYSPEKFRTEMLRIKTLIRRHKAEDNSVEAWTKSKDFPFLGEGFDVEITE